MDTTKILGNYFSVERITLAMLGSDRPGNEYRNYASGRGVCGIVIALDGSSEYRFSDGRTKLLSKGEIALFSEKTAYVVKNIENIMFPHYTINFTLNMHYNLPADETYLHTEDLAMYIKKCEKLLTYTRSGEPMAHMKAMSYLYSILADILTSSSVEMVDRKEYRSILPALVCMESEYKSKINIDLLARKCMMSNTNFRRVFTQVCGISPIEYLLKIRIERATELLRQTPLSVSEIAYMCGFKDTEYFCRTYKKRTGLTAGMIRKGVD